VKAENPGIAFTEINAVISKKWNALAEVRCSRLSKRVGSGRVLGVRLFTRYGSACPQAWVDGGAEYNIYIYIYIYIY
jgi:hypothetical protein